MSDLVSRHGDAKKLILMMREGLERLELMQAGALGVQALADLGCAPEPSSILEICTMQSGARPGDPTGLGRELGGQMAMLQKMSQDLEGIWRMAAMRENATKRAAWKGWVSEGVWGFSVIFPDYPTLSLSCTLASGCQTPLSPLAIAACASLVPKNCSKAQRGGMSKYDLVSC